MNFKKIEQLLKFNIIVPVRQRIQVLRLRRKEQINVVFIAMSLSLWRYQNIYELLNRYSRFKVTILLLPCLSYAKEQQKKDMDELAHFFSERNIPYVQGVKDSFVIDIEQCLSPDILFYPQPYSRLFPEGLNYINFKYKLLCYYPYAFWMSRGDWSYNLPLHNYAWKLFYPTELHRKEGQLFAMNKGRNIEVVGYPNADNFLCREHQDVWKSQAARKLRIIWAPHFSIFSDGYTTQSNFLWMAHFMVDIVKRYADCIQFVFKPHPRLFSELCKHEEWGEERARQYYEEWESMGNAQVESGEFVDLFMTSDAMIHDSGSFCVEYLYSGNPVMYVATNFEKQVSEKSEFGQLAMKQHYVGSCEQDVVDFIENVLLGGNDPMKHGREEFVKQYLFPPNGRTVAENTMDVLLKAFQ